MSTNYLIHYGTLGMKWGIHKQKDEINSKSRTIKKGTEIQNISSRVFDPKKSSRLYTSYTKYDKDGYADLMGNFMYNERAYKNTFVVKKDIKVPSDKQATEIFAKTVKENPDQVAKDMAKAYNAEHIFTKTAKVFKKKFSELNNPESKKTQKLAKEFMSTTVLSKKASTSANNFYANLIKNGFDAISDVNDRDGGMQDPLIIVNMKVLKGTGSVKLTRKDLDYYADYTATKNYSKSRKNLSEIQR